MARSLAFLLVCAALVPAVAHAEEGGHPVLSSRGGRSAPRDGDLVLVSSSTTPLTSTAPAPSPTPTAPAEPASSADQPLVDPGPVERWRPLVAAYPDWDANLALAVIACESGGNPQAVNPSSGAKGLFQMLGWGWLADRLFGPRAQLDEPNVNVAAAHWLWSQTSTFDHDWAASRACWAA